MVLRGPKWRLLSRVTACGHVVDLSDGCIVSPCHGEIFGNMSHGEGSCAGGRGERGEGRGRGARGARAGAVVGENFPGVLVECRATALAGLELVRGEGGGGMPGSSTSRFFSLPSMWWVRWEQARMKVNFRVAHG